MKLLRFSKRPLYINDIYEENIKTLIDFKLNNHRDHGVYILDNDNKLIKNGYQSFFYENNILVKIISEEQDEFSPEEFGIYRYDFEYFPDNKVVRKKILLEKHNYEHDSILKNSDNIDLTDLKHYLSLLPSKHKDIIETELLTNFDELYKVPKYIFNKDFEHDWMYLKPSENVVLNSDVEIITKEIISTKEGNYILLKLYDLNDNNSKWRLKCQKYYGDDIFIERGTYWYDMGRSINLDWNKSKKMDSFSDEFKLCGTELYNYDYKGVFNYLENDWLKLIIDYTSFADTDIEKGIIIRKKPYENEEKVEQWYILLRKEDEEIKNLLKEIKSY